MESTLTNEVTSSVTTYSDVTEGVQDEWQLLILRYNLRPLHTAGYMACAIYLFIVGMVASVGNTTTLVMFVRSKKLRVKPHNMLLINLALSDIGISIFGYPLTMSSCFARQWLFGDLGCQVQGFFTFFFALADMYTLTVVSVYRWVAVCLPQYNHRLNFMVTMKVIGGVWAASGFICLLPLVGMSSYTPEPFGTSCTIDWDDPAPLSAFYVYLLILIAYLLPVGVMSYCYAKVVQTSGKLIKAIRRSKGETLNIGQATEANNFIAENKVTMISLLMVLVFVVVWSPYTFLCVWAIYDPEIPVWVNTLPTMFCKASCMLNPVIFYLTNPIFRNTFRSTFLRKIKVEPQQGPAGLLTVKVDKTKDGIFIGEKSVTLRKPETTMF